MISSRKRMYVVGHAPSIISLYQKLKGAPFHWVDCVCTYAVIRKHKFGRREDLYKLGVYARMICSPFALHCTCKWRPNPMPSLWFKKTRDWSAGSQEVGCEWAE